MREVGQAIGRLADHKDKACTHHIVGSDRMPPRTAGLPAGNPVVRSGAFLSVDGYSSTAETCIQNMNLKPSVGTTTVQ